LPAFSQTVPEEKLMDMKQLVEAVGKQSKLSPAEAERAVNTVLDTLRKSKHSTIILRKNENRDAPVEARRQIFLCG
jgi:hypothetical protein